MRAYAIYSCVNYIGIIIYYYIYVLVKPGTGNGEMGNGKWETEMAGNGKRARARTYSRKDFAVLTALLLLVALAVATGRSTIVTVSRLPVLCELFEQQQLFQIEQPNSPHLFSSSSLHLWGQLLIFYSR